MGYLSYLAMGFEGFVPDVNAIFNNWFSLESRSSLSTDLISEGYPIVSNVDMGNDIIHSVIIVGEDSSGNYICLDPLIGDFTTYTLSEFKMNYISNGQAHLPVHLRRRGQAHCGRLFA